MMNDHYSVMKIEMLNADLIRFVLLLGLHHFGLQKQDCHYFLAVRFGDSAELFGSSSALKILYKPKSFIP